MYLQNGVFHENQLNGFKKLGYHKLVNKNAINLCVGEPMQKTRKM